MKHSSFTLVELMIVLAILALLAGIVIFVVKPGNILDQVKDYQRVSDLNNISKSINYLNTIQLGLLNLGSSTTIYVSLPDNTSTTCSSYALPSLPTGYTYSCQNSTNYQKNDSTGWIPINFKETDNSNILSTLPKDPVNNITYYYTYFPGGSFELTAQLTTPRDTSINDNGQSGLLYETGSPNHTVSPIVRDSSLVGYWDFNEGSGSIVADKSGHENIGTLINSPSWSTLTSTEKVINLDGTNDYINCGTSTLLLPIVYSVEAWTKTTSTNTVVPLIGFAVDNPSLNLSYGASNRPLIYLGGANFKYFNRTPYDIIDGVWHHVAFIIYGDEQNDIDSSKVYVDGLEKTVAYSAKSGPIGNKIYFRIGTNNNNWVFAGSLDEVRIYNRALSAEEIMNRYNQTKSRYE